MNKFFLMSLLVAAAITANAQDNTTKDSLTMETMMHNIPEVMVKGRALLSRQSVVCCRTICRC